jgi:predicted metalloendopeptidase
MKKFSHQALAALVLSLPLTLALADSYDLPAPTTELDSGIEPGNADPSVRPQDDLYRAVNGNWLEQTEIPPDKSSYGAFHKLRDESEIALRKIITEAADKPAAQRTPDQQKIGDFYSSFMDEARVEQLGVKPLQDELKRIDAVSRIGLVPKQLAHFLQQQINSPISGYVHQDAKDPNQYVMDLFQGGLGLPDRDYYLSDDARFVEIRAKYETYIARMFELAQFKGGAETARNIVALETELARIHWSKVESRDAVKTYNPMTLAQLKTLMPIFDWDSFLKRADLKQLQSVIISQPSYFAGLDKLLQTIPLTTWKDYFRWRLLSSAAPFLNQSLVDEQFAFNGGVLAGAKQIRPRWKRGVEVVETSLGESLGRIYVERNFPAQAKRRMDQLVKNLLAAYRADVSTLDWMGDATKQKALEKLSKFNPKIGYPKRWRDYTALKVDKNDLFGNVQRGAEFDYQRNIHKLGKPIDREEWDMTPQTVNAYYNPEKNEIVFPAAILQAPFFNLGADEATNYGAIGAVIGHEISHGFDDQGSKYDGNGALSDWWTQEDRKNFDERTHALIEQYGRYEPVSGIKINGELTIGENIADLAGLAIAYKAYHLSLGDHGAPVIDGLTGDQRFFMGWAQVWRSKYREQRLVQLLKTDPHSPGEFRCNGVVVNLPGYYEAFDVKKGDKMYVSPDSRIKLW